MNFIEKWLCDKIVKPPVDGLIANLKANETANIATIEADIASGGGNVVTSVVTFLMSHFKSPNPIVTGLEDAALPELEQQLTTALGVASDDVPTAYAAGLAFLEKEDAYL